MRKTQPKRHRIPRRGPGVAELEKILKEQHGATAQDSSISPPPPPFLFQHQHHHHHYSPTTPPLNPPHPPPPPPRDYSSWSNLPLFPTLNLIPSVLPTAASASAAAEIALFPTTGKSDTQIMNNNIHPHFQFSASSLNLGYYNSMVNLNIPDSASSFPSATSSAARCFHEIEHPSSQNNLWSSPEEQQKMVINAKRMRPFLDPNFESRRVEIFSNMAVKESSSSSSSSLEMNRTTPFHFDSNFRGTKRGFTGHQLLSSTKLADQDSNLMSLGSSSSAPNEIAAFNFHLPQETMEGLQHRDHEGGSGSDYKKITFNSAIYESNSSSKGNKEIAIGIEAEGDGIDLDLKL